MSASVSSDNLDKKYRAEQVTYLFCASCIWVLLKDCRAVLLGLFVFMMLAFGSVGLLALRVLAFGVGAAILTQRAGAASAK